MPLQDITTFIGLSNENEFFSPHYLAEVFSGDLAASVQAWDARAAAEEGYVQPHRGLRNLNQPYFALRHQLKTERSAAERIRLQREFFQQLLKVLDIPYQPFNAQVSTAKTAGADLPVLANIRDQLWVLGALDPDNEGLDPLSLQLHPSQFVGEGPFADQLQNTDWYTLLNEAVFRQDNPPRWLLLLSDRQGLLIDRYKWSQNRLLRFDWEEILGRRDDLTLKATALLLHAQSLVPEEGSSQLDTLDENSHKHAFAVSDDLKYALRQSIELLGNAATQQLIDQAREKREGIFSGKKELDPDQLSRECLRFMYRLLFLFYIEARPELGYLPHKSAAWRSGYSLEGLRDLEMVRLTSEESRQGRFFHDSLQQLFKLIYQGYQPDREQGTLLHQASENAFSLQGLDSHLFDPAKTPLLNRVVFDNATLQ